MRAFMKRRFYCWLADGVKNAPDKSARSPSLRRDANYLAAKV
jgi:hypothetical protein